MHWSSAVNAWPGNFPNSSIDFDNFKVDLVKHEACFETDCLSSDKRSDLKAWIEQLENLNKLRRLLLCVPIPGVIMKLFEPGQNLENCLGIPSWFEPRLF